MKKIVSVFILLCFLITSEAGNIPVYAQDIALPAPGTMVDLSPSYQPAMIKAMIVHKDNPFLFDFIVDRGNSAIEGETLKKEGDRLVKYFFACLTIPEKDLWVNLSPYEKDRMVPHALGQTALGRDLLAQDYILKQLTASLIYPEKNLGKTFWDRVYTKARQMYGTTQIPVNTFNKVWIVADKASVYEHGQTAFVVSGHMKVMLEEDYLALTHHQRQPANSTHSISSQIIRQIILPEIEKEVNTGKNFSTLRQIFNSLILASWYKKDLKEALLTQVYADKSTVNGVVVSGARRSREQIYEQYLQAYKKGVFNYIKEDAQLNGQTIPRKYFSGGFNANLAMTVLNNPENPAVGRAIQDVISPEELTVLTETASNAATPENGVSNEPALEGGNIISQAFVDAFDKQKRVIAVMGIPLGGKSTLARILVKEMNERLPLDHQIVMIEMDDYYSGILRLILNKGHNAIEDEKYRPYLNMLEQHGFGIKEKKDLLSIQVTRLIVNKIRQEERIMNARHILIDGFFRDLRQWNEVKDGWIRLGEKPLKIDFFLHLALPDDLSTEQLLEIIKDRVRQHWSANESVTESKITEKAKRYLFVFNNFIRPMVDEIAAQNPYKIINVSSYFPDRFGEESQRMTYQEAIKVLINILKDSEELEMSRQAAIKIIGEMIDTRKGVNGRIAKIKSDDIVILPNILHRFEEVQNVLAAIDFPFKTILDEHANLVIDIKNKVSEEDVDSWLRNKLNSYNKIASPEPQGSNSAMVSEEAVKPILDEDGLLIINLSLSSIKDKLAGLKKGEKLTMRDIRDDLQEIHDVLRPHLQGSLEAQNFFSLIRGIEHDPDYLKPAKNYDMVLKLLEAMGPSISSKEESAAGASKRENKKGLAVDLDEELTPKLTAQTDPQKAKGTLEIRMALKKIRRTKTISDDLNKIKEALARIDSPDAEKILEHILLIKSLSSLNNKGWDEIFTLLDTMEQNLPVPQFSFPEKEKDWEVAIVLKKRLKRVKGHRSLEAGILALNRQIETMGFTEDKVTAVTPDEIPSNYQKILISVTNNTVTAQEARALVEDGDAYVIAVNNMLILIRANEISADLGKESQVPSGTHASPPPKVNAAKAKPAVDEPISQVDMPKESKRVPKDGLTWGSAASFMGYVHVDRDYIPIGIRIGIEKRNGETINDAIFDKVENEVLYYHLNIEGSGVELSQLPSSQIIKVGIPHDLSDLVLACELLREAMEGIKLAREKVRSGETRISKLIHEEVKILETETGTRIIYDNKSFNALFALFYESIKIKYKARMIKRDEAMTVSAASNELKSALISGKVIKITMSSYGEIHGKLGFNESTITGRVINIEGARAWIEGVKLSENKRIKDVHAIDINTVHAIDGGTANYVENLTPSVPLNINRASNYGDVVLKKPVADEMRMTAQYPYSEHMMVQVEPKGMRSNLRQAQVTFILKDDHGIEIKKESKVLSRPMDESPKQTVSLVVDYLKVLEMETGEREKILKEMGVSQKYLKVFRKAGDVKRKIDDSNSFERLPDLVAPLDRSSDFAMGSINPSAVPDLLTESDIGKIMMILGKIRRFALNNPVEKRKIEWEDIEGKCGDIHQILLDSNHFNNTKVSGFYFNLISNLRTDPHYLDQSKNIDAELRLLNALGPTTVVGVTKLEAASKPARFARNTGSTIRKRGPALSDLKLLASMSSNTLPSLEQLLQEAQEKHERSEAQPAIPISIPKLKKLIKLKKERSLEGKRILLVDDNVFWLDRTKSSLEEMGAEVETVYNGLLDLEALKEKPKGYYDFISIDDTMATIDGRSVDGKELVQKVRKLDPDVKIAIVSWGRPLEDDRKMLSSSNIIEFDKRNINLPKSIEASILSEDQAALAPGGIDLNTSNGMQWKVSKDGNGVEMNIDPAMIARIRREGINSLSPVILRISSVSDIRSLIGVPAPTAV